MKIYNLHTQQCATALVALVLQGCVVAGDSIEPNYSEEFAWEALIVEQAYDARNPEPVFGWAKRTLDFDNSTAKEFQVLCYPGYDALMIETHVDRQASWVRDLTGALYGKTVYQEHANFAVLASGNAPVHFGTEPTRKVNLRRNAYTGEIDRPQWVSTYSESRKSTEWKVEEIAPGLHLVSMGGQDARNLLAVPGDTGWIIIGQSFDDFGYMRDAHSALTTQTGNGDVEAVFADHTHLDHYDVSNYFLSLGANLIISKAALGQLEARNIAPQATSLITFSGKMKYEAAGTIIEFHEVPNSHSVGLSLAWLPDYLVIYQGDAFSLANDGTPAPSNILTKELAVYLADHNIEFERMVGNHQSNRITWQEFNSALQMPRTVNNPDLPNCDVIREMLD